MWLRVGFLALAAAVTGLAVFLIVTVPAIIPGSALPAYSPDVGNGQMVFNAGGCSACHAAAGQDRTMLWRRARDSVAIRDLLCAQHFTRCKRRHRWLERSRLRHRAQAGNVAGRYPLLSRVSLRLLSARWDRGHPRPLRLHQDPAAGAGPDSDWSAAGNSCSSIASHCLRTLRGRRNGIGAPISSTASAIAPNVTAPQFSRRHCGLATICRWTEPGRRGMGTEHHAKGLALLVGKGRRLFPCDR